MSDQTATVRKGFSFTRLEDGGVRVRVKTGESTETAVYDDGFETVTVIPSFKEVELSALEWIDVVTSVAELSESVVDREVTMRMVVDVHMGPAGSL